MAPPHAHVTDDAAADDPVVAAVAPVVPPHRYPQHQLTDLMAQLVLRDEESLSLLQRVHASAGVEFRHLAQPAERYAEMSGFGEANDTFLQVAVDLGERAIREALAPLRLDPADVDFLMSVSVTGMGAPSIDARLVEPLGLRSDVRRLPIFGLGCVAGAAGVARMADLLRGDPDGVGVLLSVELCSLTVQRDDTSPANLVASALFGDGAAAVVMLGARRAQQLGVNGPSVSATRSIFYPGTSRVMGWDIGESGFRIVLAPGVGDVVAEHLRGDVESFLTDQDLKLHDVDVWVSHPGGPKVLQAVQESLGLDDEALALTWRSLADRGNLSSSSVLHVLADTLRERTPAGGGTGVMMAMGPGFCSELVLLRWPGTTQ
ncbi:MAG: type III polyketide synthase [Actinomycetales bacterium]